MTRTISILVVALALTGCGQKIVAVTPTPPAMPILPAKLAEEAKPLPPITGNDLHTLLRDGVAADRAYNDLRDRHNATVRAWECVRLALRDSKPVADCLK